MEPARRRRFAAHEPVSWLGQNVRVPPQDAPLAAELAREQAVVDRAQERLETLRREAAAREAEALRSSGGTPQAVYERDVAALAATARRTDLDHAGEGLVFGRLDLADGAVHHLGRLGLRTARQEPIVVDWRAPAAAPFYRATAADPLGVVRRRTISTRRRQVIGVDDELLLPDAADRLEGTTVIGDGAFVAALSRERSGQMRDIVATIQREQDEAVRAPDDGALVVTGGPGTGKTAVALHRVAYLMYARREWYERRGVLVVGPSPVFVDYISAVLPALGETSVRLASLADLPDLPRGWSVDGWDPPAAAVAKGSARMAELLRRVVRHLSGPRRVPDLVVRRWGTQVSVRGSDLARRRAQVGRGHRSHNAGRAAFGAAVLELAWRAWERRAGAARAETDPGLDGRTDFEQWLRADDSYRSWLDEVWPVLAPAEVMTSLRKGVLPLRALAGDLLGEAELVAVEDSWAGAGTRLTPADVAVWDELAELLGAPPVEDDGDGGVDDWGDAAELDELVRTAEVTTFADRTWRQARRLADDREHRTYAHVVVDEAQDVSPMQWRMVARRARGASWTVVGDWVQSAWPDVDEVRSALSGTLGGTRVRTVELTTNYRTSTEIAALAARVLGAIDPAATPPRAVRSTGVDPDVQVGDPLAGLPDVAAALLAAVTGTIGVVTAHRLLPEVTEALGGQLEDEPRLTVIDPWRVKGLEYDACIVVDPHGIVADAPTRIAGLRSLYVALTRATQRLVVRTSRPLDPLLTG